MQGHLKRNDEPIVEIWERSERPDKNWQTKKRFMFMMSW